MHQVIYITNLSVMTTELKLQDLFCRFGRILNINLLKTTISDLKGMAFIEFEEVCDAGAAIANTDGITFDGNIIHVAISCSHILRGNAAEKVL